MFVTNFAAKSRIKDLSSKLLKQSIKHAEDELLAFFNPIEKELLHLKSFYENKVIDLDQKEMLNRSFKPVMDRIPQISAIKLTDGKTKEITLFRIGENKWLEHQTGSEQTEKKRNENPAENGSPHAGSGLKKKWFKTVFRKKPQPKESVRQMTPKALITWTEPFLFYLKKQPAITASIKFKSRDGLEFVIGFDVLMEKIQIFAESFPILNNGQFMMFTSDNAARIVLFSNRPYPGKDSSIKWEPLDLIAEQNIRLIQNTSKAIKKRNVQKKYIPVRFSSDQNAWWGFSKNFSLSPDRTFRLCAVVPESDIIGDLKGTHLWIVIITIGLLTAGLIHIIILVNRISRPIKSLVLSSKHISQGFFENNAPIETNIDEFLTLTQTHEIMRTRLKEFMKLEDDIKIAREIQQKTFPKKMPDIKNFELAAWNSPASAAGGDIYDIIGYEMDSDRNCIHICDGQAQNAVLLVGDATGHGIGPALSATQIRSMLRMGVNLNPNLPQIIEHINRQLHMDLPAGRFITAWFGQIDSDDHTLQYYSAGQAPLFYYNSRENRITDLSADIYPLGIMPDLKPAAINKLKMTVGDIFAVMTDGIFEADDSHGNLLGKDRLSDLLLHSQDKSASEIIKHILRILDQHTGDREPRDDKTILIIKRCS